MNLAPTLALLGGWLLLPQSGYGYDREISACEARFIEHPEVKTSAECFFGLWPSHPAASTRLAELARRYPDAAWALFYAGAMTKGDESEEFFRAAAVRFASLGDSEDEVRARYNLYQPVEHRNLEEAELEVRHTLEAATASP